MSANLVPLAQLYMTRLPPRELQRGPARGAWAGRPFQQPPYRAVLLLLSLLPFALPACTRRCAWHFGPCPGPGVNIAAAPTRNDVHHLDPTPPAPTRLDVRPLGTSAPALALALVLTMLLLRLDMPYTVPPLPNAPLCRPARAHGAPFIIQAQLDPWDTHTMHLQLLPQEGSARAAALMTAAAAASPSPACTPTSTSQPPLSPRSPSPRPMSPVLASILSSSPRTRQPPNASPPSTSSPAAARSGTKPATTATVVSSPAPSDGGPFSARGLPLGRVDVACVWKGGPTAGQARRVQDAAQLLMDCMAHLMAGPAGKEACVLASWGVWVIHAVLGGQGSAAYGLSGAPHGGARRWDLVRGKGWAGHVFPGVLSGCCSWAVRGQQVAGLASGQTGEVRGGCNAHSVGRPCVCWAAGVFLLMDCVANLTAGSAGAHLSFAAGVQHHCALRQPDASIAVYCPPWLLLCPMAFAQACSTCWP